jgi:hypothetical protein
MTHQRSQSCTYRTHKHQETADMCEAGELLYLIEAA